MWWKYYSRKKNLGFTADVITIRRDRGGGRRRVVNIEVDRLRKKFIFSIPSNEEGLCCAKAIVFAKAHWIGDQRKTNGLRDNRRPALVNAVRKLHEDAKVPLGLCSYNEIKQFEEFFNIQIAVVSTQNLNKVSLCIQFILLLLHDFLKLKNESDFLCTL